MKGLWRYWGWVLLIIVAAGTINNAVGPAPLMFMSGLVLIYFLFNAPGWCAVPNRGKGLCRENSNGLLLGCWRRQHKWQKLTLTFVPAHWRKMVTHIKKESPIEGVKLVTVLIGLVAGIVTLSVAGIKIITG